MNAFLSLIGAFLDAFGRAFLDWLRDKRFEAALSELGAARERERVSDEVLKASQKAGEIVASRDTDVAASRLRNGEF